MSGHCAAKAVSDVMTTPWSRQPPRQLLTGIGPPMGNRAAGPLVEYLRSVVPRRHLLSCRGCHAMLTACPNRPAPTALSLDRQPDLALHVNQASTVMVHATPRGLEERSSREVRVFAALALASPSGTPGRSSVGPGGRVAPSTVGKLAHACDRRWRLGSTARSWRSVVAAGTSRCSWGAERAARGFLSQGRTPMARVRCGRELPDLRRICWSMRGGVTVRNCP